MTRDEKLNALQSLQSRLKQFFASRRLPSDPQVVAAWVAGLMQDGVTVPQAVEALNQFDLQCSDFATVAGVRRYLPGTLGLSLEERAVFAWGSVVQAVRQIGRYASWNFDDPVTNAAVRRIGGQGPLCCCPEGDMHFRQRDFVAAYCAVARTGIGDARPVSGLPGFHEDVRQIATDLHRTEAGERLRIESQPDPLPLIAHRGGTVAVPAKVSQ